VLITIGVLLMLQMTSWRFPLRDTWPVILIVVGVVKLVQRLAPTTGHHDILDVNRPPLTSAPPR
jgi:hypothetical protein